jgi:arylsulfatase A-like enzyme
VVHWQTATVFGINSFEFEVGLTWRLTSAGSGPTRRHGMTERHFVAPLLLFSISLAFFEGGCSSKPAKPIRPNVIVIVTDDQGYADLSAYTHSATDIHTPNMDRIAKAGVLFTRGYVTAPVCSPSRAGWNIGRYQQRWDPRASWGPGLPHDEKLIAEYFKEAGYVTGKIGKSDFGRNYHKQDVREYPLNHGYAEFLGFSSHGHDYFLLSEDMEKRTPDPYGGSAALGALFENRGRKSFEKGYTTEIFTEWAIDFLERHKEDPFFLTVSYNSLHALIHQVPEPYLKKFEVKPIPNYEPETMGNYREYFVSHLYIGRPISDEDMRKYYLANLNCLDDNIGRLLNTMDRLGLTENTILVLFSDNGGAPFTGASNRPLRGSKFTTFEGGLRVPFIMSWPRQLPKGHVYPYRVSTLDLMPTILEAVGIPVRATSELDGESILEAVKAGQASPAEARPLFWKFGNRWAVLDGDWKLLQSFARHPQGPSSQILVVGDDAERAPALFNIKEDQGEQHNVAKGNPEVVKRLTELYQRWEAEVRQEATPQKKE